MKLRGNVDYEINGMGNLGSIVNHAPRISVVVPVFNVPADILEISLGSVRDQTFTDFECLVVDDSTDRSLAEHCREICAKDERFKYIKPSERLGLPASLNLGISLAAADLIARFDSDDICAQNRFFLQINFFNNNPEIGVLGGALEIVSNQGLTLAFRDYPLEHDLIEAKFQTSTSIAHPTVMFRKDLIRKYGGYDSRFRFSEDLDIWLRLLNRGVRFANLSDVLVSYRQDTVERNPAHWRYNIKARIKNFSSRYFIRRVLGILLLSIWVVTPVWIKKRIFKLLLLRNASHR